MRTEKNLKSYLWERVELEPNTGCWLWSLHLDRYGYGQTAHKSKRITAHRLSYIAFKGPIPNGLSVCHKCDTPACINPDHLWLGTNKQNAEDSVKKGRRSHTHCVNGHEFTPENTYIKRHRGKEYKACKICILNRSKSEKYKARNRHKTSLQTQEKRDLLAKKRREYNAKRKEHISKLRKERRLNNLKYYRDLDKKSYQRKKLKKLLNQNAKPN